jgi:pullulanase
MLHSTESFGQYTSVRYEDYPVYTGNDLGVRYSPKGTAFKVWAPNAEEVKLRLYRSGDGGEASSAINLAKSSSGTWQTTVAKNIKDQYYTFQVKQSGQWLDETADIYAKATGVNGKRGMIVDLAATNPAGWSRDKGPVVKNQTDVVLYESHIRDLSISPNSGVRNKGKYTGLAEKGTKGPGGVSTGLDHLKELGITHLHLLPAFDFNSVDESSPKKNSTTGVTIPPLQRTGRKLFHRSLRRQGAHKRIQRNGAGPPHGRHRCGDGCGV